MTCPDSRRPRVLVMMATYNGARYLREQIDSILAQEDVEVTLRICDDRSTDDTAEICREYQERDSRVRFSVNQENLGCAMNFMQMVYEADAGAYDFFAFSDQDDVWLPKKMMTAIGKIGEKEADPAARRFESFGIPTLYCSDFLDVSASLENGVRELTITKPDLNRRATLLVRNLLPGCTMVFNTSFLRLIRIRRYRTCPRFHDAFAACVAYYCGNTVVDFDNALILRRITGHNVCGAVGVGTDFRKAKFARVATSAPRDYQELARRLIDDYGDFLSSEDKRMISSFLRYRKNALLRIAWVLSRRYFVISHRDNMVVRAKFLFGRF